MRRIAMMSVLALTLAACAEIGTPLGDPSEPTAPSTLADNSTPDEPQVNPSVQTIDPGVPLRSFPTLPREGDPEKAAQPIVGPLSDRVTLAVGDLASRLAVSPDEISVLADEDVTWPDGSIGCPQPGLMYTQALVDGYRVLLQSGSAQYSYHGAGDGEPFLCERPSLPVPAPNQ